MVYALLLAAVSSFAVDIPKAAFLNSFNQGGTKMICQSTAAILTKCYAVKSCDTELTAAIGTCAKTMDKEIPAVIQDANAVGSKLALCGLKSVTAAHKMSDLPECKKFADAIAHPAPVPAAAPKKK